MVGQCRSRFFSLLPRAEDALDFREDFRGLDVTHDRQGGIVGNEMGLVKRREIFALDRHHRFGREVIAVGMLPIENLGGELLREDGGFLLLLLETGEGLAAAAWRIGRRGRWREKRRRRRDRESGRCIS